MTTKTTIRVTYSTIDRYRETRRFVTLKGAQRYAQKWIGECPEYGVGYAVSHDGIGKITCEGCKVVDLFPRLAPAPEPEYRGYDQMPGAPGYDPIDYEDPPVAPKRAPGCKCSNQQLNLVGCDCPKRAPGCTCTDQQLYLVGCDCDVDRAGWNPFA